MYKGKGILGAEPIGEMRTKRVPKESRRTLGAHSHEQSKMDAYSGKNELSKCMLVFIFRQNESQWTTT
jgi:hypothetical protein